MTAAPSKLSAMSQSTIHINPVRYELPVEMLEGFRARAGELDRTNTYFHDDLAELRAFGYLAAAVPAEFGGAGLDLVEMAASQRRLARYAPATALAMTMHSYWIGIAVRAGTGGRHLAALDPRGRRRR
jgi:alkylation response protein AidB-like acyl-CoA dehydrogenase